MKKCGYVPANGISLKSNKLCHELIMTPNGEVDDNFNGTEEATLMEHIEDWNHAVVDCLVRKVYRLAIELKPKLRQVTRHQASNDNNRDQVAIRNNCW